MQAMQAEPLVTTPDHRTPSAVPASLPLFARYTLAPLSLLGAAVALYLLSLALAHRGLPAGCGQGSGCDEVLSSRWAQVFGFPVSGLAFAVYGGILIALVSMRFATSAIQRRRAWSALSLFGTLLVGSAIWFVGLQLVVIKAICPWCLAEHGLGLLVAAIVFFSAPALRKAVLAAGVVLVGGMALAQGFGAFYAPNVLRLPADENADTGPGSDRLITVLNGQLALTPHGLPVLGSADAPKLLVVLFDYCCPHCRATHGYLLEILAAQGGELAVVMLPTPLNSKCNPYWEETETRFEHACELARLALAVYLVDPTAFARFDAWLFETETPRDPTDARHYAETLVSKEALGEALQGGGWIDGQIEQNVTAYHNSGAARVPVILSPGMRAIVGRPESEKQLFELLEKELTLRPTQASTTK